MVRPDREGRRISVFGNVFEEKGNFGEILEVKHGLRYCEVVVADCLGLEGQ